MYRALIVLATAVFAIGTDSFVIAGILPGIADSLDVSTSAAGQLITAYALAYAVFSPVMAAATARWPRRRVLLAGLTVFTLGNLATALLPDYGLVLAARVVSGLGGAMVTPAATATGASLAPAAKRGTAIAIVTTGLSAATALGAPIGTALGSLAGDWRITMTLVVGLGVLSMIGVAVLLPPVATPPAVSLRRRLAPLGDARVALTLLTALLLFTGLYTVYSYISLSFDRATGGNGSTLAALLFVWGVSATAGTLGTGRLLDRYGNRRVLTVAAAVSAVDFALLPLTSRHLATAAVALVLWGTCGWAAVPATTHRLIGVMPEAAPLLTGLSGATVYIGVSLASAVGAVGVTLVGAHSLGVVGAVFIAAALGCGELAHRTIRQRPVGPETVAHQQLPHALEARRSDRAHLGGQRGDGDPSAGAAPKLLRPSRRPSSRRGR